MFILLLGKIKFYHVKVAEKITTAQSSVHNINDNNDRNDNNNNNINKNHGGSAGGGRSSSSKRKNKPKNMVDN